MEIATQPLPKMSASLMQAEVDLGLQNDAARRRKRNSRDIAQKAESLKIQCLYDVHADLLTPITFVVERKQLVLSLPAVW